MGNHRWQQLRVVHDMLRWKQPTLVQALACKRSADSYHVHPCRQRRLHTGRRIFDDQTLFRLHLQFTGQKATVERTSLWMPAPPHVVCQLVDRLMRVGMERKTVTEPNAFTII